MVDAAYYVARFREASSGLGRAGTADWPGGPYMAMGDAAAVYADLMMGGDGKSIAPIDAPVEGLTSGEGWKLVPVEPTGAMVEAGIPYSVNASWVQSLWAAMLAASPATLAGGVREAEA